MIILGYYNSSHLLRYRWVYIRPLSGPRHFRLYSPPRRHTSCRCPRSRHFRSYNQTRTPCSSVGGKKKCTMCLYLIKQYQMLTIADEYHYIYLETVNAFIITSNYLRFLNYCIGIKQEYSYSPLLWHNIIQVKKQGTVYAFKYIFNKLFEKKKETWSFIATKLSFPSFCKKKNNLFSCMHTQNIRFL